MSCPFRFIHASDFHLERPLFGLAAVPEHLRELFVDAPYLAARRVFDAALAEEVDFMVLAGDLAEPEMAGPGGPLFLVEQFKRLQERGIAVYWAGGQVDPPEAWPASIALPDNVRVFSRQRPEEVVHHRDGERLARLVGFSRRRGHKIRPGDFWPDSKGPFSIALTYGTGDNAALAARGIDYWALGGRHTQDTHHDGRCLLHYPGTVQGREPAEPGPRGCTLVQVIEGPPQLRQVPCDVVRWLDEAVEVDETTTADALRQMLGRRLQSLAAATPGLDLLVSWTADGGGKLLDELGRGTLAARLLAGLNEEFGRRRPAVFSTRLAVAPLREWPADWCEQDTILGDFVRTVRRLVPHRKAAAGGSSSEAPMLDLVELSAGLENLLSERHRAGTLADGVRLGDEKTRRRVLAKAAALGADLLRGEEPKT
ncbi:MAG: hypothetical protein WD847_12955 [Pirellulales bacterium]